MFYPSKRVFVLALSVAAAAVGVAKPGGETTGALIEGPTYAPPSPGAADSVTVTATIKANGWVAEGVSVAYATSDTPTPVTVSAFDDGKHGDGAAGDSVFGAILPPQPAGTKVTFQFSSRGNNGKTVVSASRSYISARAVDREFRAIWADSWNESFLSTTQTDSLVETCRDANINTIIPEVRKVGDACYKSDIEPRANNITGGDEFDPLGYLIRQAHDTGSGKRRLQVHAWFVMQRIQKDKGPLDPGHILQQHPEYEMLKADGTHTETRYLDPGHPGAVEHNVAVILDCLKNYDIDGIHMDYIRYPEYPGPWGYNQVSVQRFNALRGKSGMPAASDPDWCAWRRECVTLQVRKIYIKAWQMKPGVLLSASTVNWGYNFDNFSESAAYKQAFQNWAGWLEEGILDYNGLMNYVRDDGTTRLLGWTNCSLSRDARRGSIIGVGAYLHTSIENSIDQLLYVRSSGAAGLNIYDWGSEVQANRKGETREQFYAALKDRVFESWVDPPESPWKSGPSAEGVLEGTVTHQGRPVDHARVWIDGHPETETVTDGMGWYGILNVPAGAHVVRATKNGMGESTSPDSESQPGKVVTVNLSLGAEQNAGADGPM